MRLRIAPRVTGRLKNIITAFQQHKDYQLTFKQLISEDVSIKQHWKNDLRFRDHVGNRYASEGHIGGAILSTKSWPKGSRIDSLIGCIAELNYEDEVSFLRHKENDFSVMYSSRKNKSQLWLGPAAYVNHDCRPNCAFTINCDGDDRMSLTATTDIKSGDEIYIYYGKHFFDTNNASCECFTCELLERGSFSTGRVGPITAAPASAAAPFSSAEYLSSSTTSSTYSLSLPSSRGGKKSACALQEDGLVAAIKERLRRAPLAHRTALPNLRNRSTAVTTAPSTSAPTCAAIAEPTAAAAMSGLLVKGLSTGLARNVVNTAVYSLRHTNSRLTRVKAKIYSAMLSSLNQSPPQQQQGGEDQSQSSHQTFQEGIVLRPRKSAPLATSTGVASSTQTKMALGGRMNSRTVMQPGRIDVVKRRRCLQRGTSTTAVPVAVPTNKVEPSLHNPPIPLRLSHIPLPPPAPSSPSSSSTSTIAATEADEALAVQMPPRSRSRLKTRRFRTVSTTTTSAPSTYFLRRSACPKPPAEPMLIDLSVESTSTCSSLSTCPAVSATPRLVIVRKQSRQEEVEGAQDMWFVKDCDDSDGNGDITEHKPTPTPPILHTSGGGGRGWTTSASSVVNTPSPPHLQAVSPTPPILQRAEDRMLFSFYGSTAASAAPALDSDGVSDSGSSPGTAKPLTVRIKRMGRRLYCVPPESATISRQRDTI
ncbi:Histone-lysine N-methyltransferase SUV420H1-A [Echinococcus granulosus]|uniref:Histone-lysine N-methyltransferase SUV420H1-A n=1 Tax=Echinococcus granulosus TaxID=6210 RepID=W6USJ0_ECHGR|nr:Histone-lysine N-methyltransferase SUV420H1-A [Echinococcus granulosus]EUB61332.1 Histone-lysine N-methyltransferase SUV420H1-A [Echinococcus granulosus]